VVRASIVNSGDLQPYVDEPLHDGLYLVFREDRSPHEWPITHRHKAYPRAQCQSRLNRNAIDRDFKIADRIYEPSVISAWFANA